MGLAISVGVLADLIENDPEGAGWLREELKKVNRILRKRGLPEHVEPEQIPEELRSLGFDGFPYSFLHYLRRAQACLLSGTPLREGEMTDADKALIDRVGDRNPTHLMTHSDCEGFYVPVDFARPIIEWPSWFARLRGRGQGVEMLGSSIRLQDELLQLAPFLKIEMRGGQPTSEEAARIEAIDEADGPLHRELIVWLTLWHACEFSIRHKSAISFD